MSIRHRQDASPAKIMDRPLPYRWTATSGYTAPLGVDVTASTVAPGLGPPSGALAANAGNAAHAARRSPDVSIRMTGCVSPSGVTITV